MKKKQNSKILWTLSAVFVVVSIIFFSWNHLKPYFPVQVYSWKTYTKPGEFSINYPGNWYLSSEYKNNNSISCISMSDKDFSKVLAVQTVVSHSDITGVISICYFSGNAPAANQEGNNTVFLQNPAGGYVQIDWVGESKNLFNQVLSTFRFN